MIYLKGTACGVSSAGWVVLFLQALTTRMVPIHHTSTATRAWSCTRERGCPKAAEAEHRSQGETARPGSGPHLHLSGMNPSQQLNNTQPLTHSSALPVGWGEERNTQTHKLG